MTGATVIFPFQTFDEGVDSTVDTIYDNKSDGYRTWHSGFFVNADPAKVSAPHRETFPRTPSTVKARPFCRELQVTRFGHSASFLKQGSPEQKAA